ncbi:hypothetical protein E5Q_05533 [Mixia osmundae IAM 14324]|uniref:DNA-directed RNA polymerases I and III subunit RPAC1 n=1 Tax=Mixia osmundae (strain CBS 9802 / IAM 14324 / JCM 22182 / KY 12970) TaxID=764103 RepID=G7E7N5_MIXOS|nr:hypothetical protein E5Q_05533 [Mixia osmundae IAM 14324]
MSRSTRSKPKPQASEGQPTARVEPLVHLGPERVTNVASEDMPNATAGVEDQGWNAEAFKAQLGISILSLSPSEIEFDIIGIDAAIANALRRIMIAEVPTVAIETVFVFNNTSIVQDEVLSQRLGLVPLKINPRQIDFKTPDEGPTDLNTVVFSLLAKCEHRPGHDPDEKDPDELYIDSNVFSGKLEWKPQGAQESMFDTDATRPRPVQDDILLAKLRPGQTISVELHCNKGNGKTHAKWSPVATASYRLMPHIRILKPIPEHLCEKFKSCFQPGVIGIKRDLDGTKCCSVDDPRRDTVSREVLRHPEFEGYVSLGRVRDHFIYNVESTGQYEPEDLLEEACGVMLSKIQAVRASLHELSDSGAKMDVS